ncbi:MAG: FecR domain-containing protein [Chitinophagaceae bacterium]
MSRERIWLLASKKLAHESTPEELQELEQLLRLDPDLHYPLQHITDIWQLPARLPRDAEDVFHRHIERMKATGADWQEENRVAEGEETGNARPAGTRYFKKVLAGICVMAVMVVAGMIFYKKGTDREAAVVIRNHYEANAVADADRAEVATRNGSKRKVVLPDGTQVWLNAGSKLLYNKDFGQGTREAQLTGEAYFDVVKNPQQPFIIHTRDIDIKVLGTAFNVRSYPDEQRTETSLIHGRIEVGILNRPNEKIILKPNEKLVVTGDTQSAVADVERAPTPMVSIGRLTYEKKDSTVVETAWVYNKLLFNDESFDAIAKKMERWYGVSIEFEDSSVEQLRFSGVFESEPLVVALEALHISDGKSFHYSINGKHVIITR